MNNTNNKRYVKISALVEYLGCGRNSAIDIGKASGAKIYITDKLIVYDLELIDAYLASKSERSAACPD